ncbi:MAG: hypothetical protein ACXU9A_20455, partial [Xanthobacteraceae bacterium]
THGLGLLGREDIGNRDPHRGLLGFPAMIPIEDRTRNGGLAASPARKPARKPACKPACKPCLQTLVAASLGGFLTRIRRN